MKNLNDYIDPFGMVVTKFDRDGGDSCAHGCAILYANSRLRGSNYIDIIELLFPSTPVLLELRPANGLYRRHPDPVKWYSRNNTFSRDQLTPLLAYYGHNGGRPRLNRLFWQHMKRLLLFAWNTTDIDTYPGEKNYRWKIPDLTGPDIWGMWIRAYRFLPFYPLLLLFDIPTLISSFIYRYKLSDSTLQMNHTIVVDYSNAVMPTPVSWLAKRIYGKETPKAALKISWGPEWQPPIDEYLTRLVDTW